MERTPRSRGQWQAAVDAAEVSICLHVAADLGELEPEKRPAMDRDECEAILQEGEARGITPGASCLARWLASEAVVAD